jgi:hypothetical protein
MMIVSRWYGSGPITFGVLVLSAQRPYPSWGKMCNQTHLDGQFRQDDAEFGRGIRSGYGAEPIVLLVGRVLLKMSGSQGT